MINWDTEILTDCDCFCLTKFVETIRIFSLSIFLWFLFVSQCRHFVKVTFSSLWEHYFMLKSVKIFLVKCKKSCDLSLSLVCFERWLATPYILECKNHMFCRKRQNVGYFAKISWLIKSDLAKFWDTFTAATFILTFLATFSS